MTLANIHSCKDFFWRGCERSWSDCSCSVIYYSWHGAVSNLCLFDSFFYLLCKSVKSFPLQLLLRNTGSHAKRKKVELTGGRSAAGGSAQVSLITLTTAAGPEQQSNKAAEQSWAVVSPALPWHLETATVRNHVCTMNRQPADLLPRSLIFLMRRIFISSKCCSSKCRCDHSDSKAWKFWLGWTKSS